MRPTRAVNANHDRQQNRTDAAEATERRGYVTLCERISGRKATTAETQKVGEIVEMRRTR
jgi:hypothetical protein